MARRPHWWHHLQASKQEALLAVDLYNQSRRERRLEAFVVHMHMAWLYRRWTHPQSGADRADHSRLLKLGLVELDQGTPRLTETAAYSLCLPTQPKAAKRKPRRRG